MKFSWERVQFEELVHVLIRCLDVELVKEFFLRSCETHESYNVFNVVLVLQRVHVIYLRNSHVNIFVHCINLFPAFNVFLGLLV